MFVGRDEELNKPRICTPNKVANGTALILGAKAQALDARARLPLRRVELIRIEQAQVLSLEVTWAFALLLFGVAATAVDSLPAAD